ncbi:LOW QUALITY PROTEIN: myosin-15 [Trichechus inunguis]
MTMMQTMLGESGTGKTVNIKHDIQYFAIIAVMGELTSFTLAGKGKFIRKHFGVGGKLSFADIDIYKPCADKTAFLIGVSSSELVKGLIHPRIKVVNGYVTRGQTMEQVTCAIGSLSKSIYEKMFKWLVAYLNRALDAKPPRRFFISILDITGFEILDYNSLEQFFKFANEKLQQFFNQQFALEQEEYKEDIDLSIDFGLDLQACIDLIEKPLGILSILEEEYMFSKATDRTFKTKFFDDHFGKSVHLQKPKPNKRRKYEAHFELVHYAGVVPYDISGSLKRTKALVNETAVAIFQKTFNSLLASFFEYISIDSILQFGEKNCKKGFSFQMAVYLHKENLNKFMTNLKSTAPHFMRCINPNVNKIPVLFKIGFLDPETMRDEGLSKVFTLFQARTQGKLIQIKFQKMLEERDALLLIWNIRDFMAVKNWPWMRLFFKIKPFVKSVQVGKEIARLKKRCALEKSEFQREELKAKQVSLIWKKNDLLLQLTEQETLVNVEEQCKSLIKSKIQLEARVKELSEQLEEEKEINPKLTARERKLEDECSDLKREINDLETVLAKSEKKEREMSQMSSEVVSEKGLAAQLQKMVKELQTQIQDLKEKLESERTTRAKVERERVSLTELENLNERLEEGGGATLAQLEINKKQETKFQKLHQDTHFEATSASLKKGHADNLAELEGQVENVQCKQKQEKDKSDLQLEVDDLLIHTEQMTRAELHWALWIRQKFPLDITVHSFQPSDQVLIRKWKDLPGNAEMVQWRKKYKNYAIQGTEDLEDSKTKLAIRLQEAAEAIEGANARNTLLERARHQLQLQLRDALSDLGKACSPAATLDQKQRLGQGLAAWKQKHEESWVVLNTSQKEAQALLKLKHAHEESTVSQKTLRRENKNFQEEISGLTNHVKEGNKNLSEMEKVKELIKQEKTEVVALEEANGALECNESKILHFQLELLDAKAELERKLSEKDEEVEKFSCSWKTAIDNRYTNGCGQIRSTDIGLPNPAYSLRYLAQHPSGILIGELNKAGGLRDFQAHLDDSTRPNSDLKEQVAVAEAWHNSLLQPELEELRALQKQTERGHRLAEEELLETTERINLFYTTDTSVLNQKKELEITVAYKQKAEEVVRCQNAEEKAKKAAKAANMSEELKKEQDTNDHLERMRNNMEPIKDLQKADEAEQTSLKGSRKQVQKLESRVRELEGELEGEAAWWGAQRGARRPETQHRGLTYQAEEDKKNLSMMQTLMDTFQLKVQSYKQQVEAVEAQANQYLSKYKKQQHQLNEPKERAEIAESQVNNLKIKAKVFGKLAKSRVTKNTELNVWQGQASRSFLTCDFP